MPKSKLPNFNNGHIPVNKRKSELEDEEDEIVEKPQVQQVPKTEIVQNQEEVKKPVPKEIPTPTEIVQPKKNPPKSKELVIGETLLGTKSGKFNNHLVELSIFYGNFVKPMIRNKNSGELEFITIKEDEYNLMLEDFLSSEEGRNYRMPTQDEILQANATVHEKTKRYMDSLKAKKEVKQETPKEEPVQEKVAHSTIAIKKGQPEIENKQEKLKVVETEVKKPKSIMMESDKEFNKKELKFVDDVVSYSEQELDKYKKQGFSEAQLEQIEEGLNNDIDVSHYAYKDMSPAQMERERKKLQYEMGLANEAKDKFNQDYTEQKEQRAEEILQEEDDKAVSVVKGTAMFFGIVIFALLCVAGCIILITILLKAFQTYSSGLF